MESQTPAGSYISRLHPRRRYFVKGTSTTIPALTSSCTAGIQERKLSIEVQPPQAAKTEKKITKKKSHTVVSISLGNIAPRHGVGSLRTLVDGEISQHVYVPDVGS